MPKSRGKSSETVPIESILDAEGMDFLKPFRREVIGAESVDELVEVLSRAETQWKQKKATRTPISIEHSSDGGSGLDDPDVQLLDKEKKALTKLHRRMCKKSSSTACIWHRPHEGVTFSLRYLHRVPNFDYDHVVYAAPSPDEPSIGPIISNALKAIGSKRAPSVSALRSELAAKNALLVVFDLHLLFSKRDEFDKSGSLNELLMNPSERIGGEERSKVRVLLCCADTFRPLKNFMADRSHRELDYAPVFNSEYVPIDNMIANFVELRRKIDDTRVYHFRDPSPEGPRMKRFRHGVKRAYAAMGQIPVTSVTIRAAALSDPLNTSENDPTQGFQKMLGAELIQASQKLKAVERDIKLVIECLSERHLQVLRLVSTGVFWFSRAMLDHLRENDPSLVDLEWERDVVDLVQQHKALLFERSSQKGLVRSPLAVRAVVQDHWIASGDKRRERIHFAIAEYLAAKADQADLSNNENETFLGTEYPFQPPKEGPQLVLRAEAIRHFVRASQNKIDCDRTCIENAVKQFHLLNTLKTLESMHDHALSRSVGRHHLKLELLHLLSVDGHGETPFPSMPAEFLDTYYLDLAVSRLSMLQIDEARVAFDAAIHSENQSMPTRLSTQLHLASAEIFGLDYDAVEKVLEEVEKGISRLPLSQQGAFEKRLIVRRANLLTAQGKADEAVKTFMSLLDHGKVVAFTGDRVFAMIDAILASKSKNPDWLQIALSLIESNTPQEIRECFPHEMLRYDTRRARVFNALDMPHSAESILDNVCLSLSKHGGSARALHDFLFASGETLIALGEYEWAYAGYLNACYRRASHRNVKQFMRDTALLCSKALTKIIENLSQLPEGDRLRTVSDCLDRRKPVCGTGGALQSRAQYAHERSKHLWKQIEETDVNNPNPLLSFDLSILEQDRSGWAERLCSDRFLETMLEKYGAEI